MLASAYEREHGGFVSLEPCHLTLFNTFQFLPVSWNFHNLVSLKCWVKCCCVPYTFFLSLLLWRSVGGRQTWSLLHLTQEQLEGAFVLFCGLQDCMFCEGTVCKMTKIALWTDGPSLGDLSPHWWCVEGWMVLAPKKPAESHNFDFDHRDLKMIIVSPV